MKKRFSVMLLFLLTVLIMTGCGSYKVDQSTLFINGNGSLVLSEVEPFPENQYSKEELQIFIDENIDDYNNTYGKGSVELKSLKVKDGIVRMVTEFASADVYAQFTGTELSYGRIKDASASGVRFTGDFVAVKKDAVSYCALEDILSSGKLHYLIVRDDMRIRLPGNVMYASEEGVSLLDTATVLTGAGRNMLQAAELPSTEEASTEEASTENTAELLSAGETESSGNTEEVSGQTEAGSDGSISDEDLLLAVEEAKQQENGVFNFAEESEEAVQSTQKYFVIIFK